MDAQAFIDIVGEMINHNPDSLYPKRRQLDPYSDLNYQCVEDSFDLKVRADYLTLGLRESGRNSTARILNFHLARNPEIAFFVEHGRQLQQPAEPGVVHLLPVHPDADSGGGRPVKTHSEANLKYMDLREKVEDLLCQMVSVRGERSEGVGELRQRLGSGQSSVVSYFLNITAILQGQ